MTIVLNYVINVIVLIQQCQEILRKIPDPLSGDALVTRSQYCSPASKKTRFEYSLYHDHSRSNTCIGPEVVITRSQNQGHPSQL